MAHKAQFNFFSGLKKKHSRYFKNKRVLEIGSYDVNGTVREFFKNCDYTGIDVAPGKCVDIVCAGDKFTEPDNSYDVCLSTECFEHNPKWVETFNNMIRMTKPGGLVIMTCATDGRPEHGTINIAKDESLTTNIQGWETYYRNLTESDFREKFSFTTVFSEYSFITNVKDCDLYFYGFKKTLA